MPPLSGQAVPDDVRLPPRSPNRTALSRRSASDAGISLRPRSSSDVIFCDVDGVRGLDSCNGAVCEDSMQPEKMSKENGVPLSLVFEGQSSTLTVLVHCAIALRLVVLVADRMWIFGQGIHTWAEEFVFYVAASFVAATIAAVAIGVLSLNQRPVSKNDWRLRSFRSFVALVLLNGVAVETFLYAIMELRRDEARVTSTYATLFMGVVDMLLTIGFDFIYFRRFGVCVCCCGGNVGDRLVMRAEEWERHPHPRKFIGGRAGPVEGSEQGDVLDQDSKESADIESSSKDVALEEAPDRIESPHPSNSEVGPGVVVSVPTVTELEPVGEASEKRDRLIPRNESYLQRNTPPKLAEIPQWTTMKLVEIGSQKLSTQEKRTRINSKARSVIEIEARPVDAAVECESASFVPDVMSMVRKFLNKDDSDSRLRRCFKSPGEIWGAVREEPGHFRYAVWIKSSFFISVIVLIFSAIRTVSFLSSLTERYRENRTRFMSNLSQLNDFLEGAGWTEGIDDITKTVLMELYSIADAVILDLSSVSWVGYALGTLVGLGSLVAVLIQHKRVSLAVADGLRSFRAVALAEDKETESPWPSFQQKYPILGACLFLAILSSTAVIQLHLVGGAVCILLCLLVNFFKLSVLFDIFGCYIGVYILVFCVDLFVMRFLKSWLITEDGAHIRHPRWFNFTIVVLSMVHLVIGWLYALWRVLYLLITSIVVLNRLDVCLFTTGKSLDNGHNAFMSMLVLTVLVQEDHESFITRS